MKAIIDPLLVLLNATSTTKWLFALNLVIAAALAYALRGDLGGDFASYMALADGIIHGSYSPWWSLDVSIPDTFRSPGYPLFIALVFLFSHSTTAITIAQFLMYGVALLLTLRLIDRMTTHAVVAKNLFLILLLPLINVPFYISKILPEIPVLAAISAAVLLHQKYIGRSIWKAVLLGLTYGFIYHCRPVFLLFPFGLFVLDFFMRRKDFDLRSHIVTLATFCMCLLPYGMWNLQNHGKFSVTPLEGGGGVMHIGYWAGLIPEHPGRYWGNFTGDEIVNFASPEEVTLYKKQYDAEWDSIDTHMAGFITPVDTIMFSAHKSVRYSPKTYSTSYTLERERILKEITFEHIKENPGYFIRYKLYSAVRLWVTGIQKEKFKQASAIGKVSQLYPPIMLLAVLIAFLYFCIRAIRKLPKFHKEHYFLYCYMLYSGAIYIPFVIQSRYTTPVRFIMITLIAVSIVQLFPKLTQKEEKTREQT